MRITSLFCLVCLFSAPHLYAQDSIAVKGHPIVGYPDEARGNSSLRMVFYNLENLFDWEDDSSISDEEYTPTGDRYWNPKKFWAKQRKIAQTLIAVGGWEPPAVVGVCEVENRYCLEELVTNTALRNAGYQIVHENSADRRGIDVAMLYRQEKFNLISYEYIRVKFDEPDARPTRDILYVKGVALHQDTVHIFVNHWPSRYGGHLVTNPKRMRAAETVRHKVDSIFATNPSANIIITGDFNDHPEDASLVEGLRAKHKPQELQPKELFNMMYEKQHKEGTHKFQGEWGVLDMWIVSEGLYNGRGKLALAPDAAKIFKAPFLLEEETVHLGKRPFRTYQGLKYVGGYSDHLPIVLDLKVVE